MTVTSLGVRNELTANAAQTVFNYTFLIFGSSDLNVYITPSGQTANDANDITTAYTIDPAGIGNPAGGFITLDSGTSSGDLVTIVSNIADSRTTDYQKSGDFEADVVNDDFDRTLSLVKQQLDSTSRTLSFPQSLQNASSLSLPIPAAGQYVVWNGSETGLINSGAPGTIIESDLTGTTIQMVANASLSAGDIIITTGHSVTGDSGDNTFLARAVTGATADGGSLIKGVGNAAIEFVGLFPKGIITAAQYGILPDWNGTTGTDNTPQYQVVIDKMQAGDFNRLTFSDIGQGYYFAPVGGKTTCIFLGVDATDWQENPNPLTIDGDGTIVVDNASANNVWMSGPDDSTGTTPVNVVNDVNIEGSLMITSSVIDRGTFDSPFTTMTNFAIGFNVSRWWRSAFTFNNEFAKGLVQAPSADGLYDSTNSFVQQIKIHDCHSTHAQENFIEFSQGWSVDILGNTIERGNGGIDMQRSSGQAFFRTRIVGNTIQANGITNPFKCNFGVAFTFSSNYFESNRASSGVAIEQVKMSANNVQDLNSLIFEGNFFSQGATALDGFGAEYPHVVLDAFRGFYPKSNNFSGGNSYKMTNSTGLVVSENETRTLAGSVETEGLITISSSAIEGVVKLPGVYQDDDSAAKANITKIASGVAGFKTMESVNIADGASYTFRKIGRPLCNLVAGFTVNTIGSFTCGDAGTAPEALAVTAGTLFEFSATPSVPTAGSIDIAVNAGSDGITVYNRLGSARNFVLEQLGTSDWV